MPCPFHQLRFVDPVPDCVFDDDVQHQHREKGRDAFKDRSPYNDLRQFNLQRFEVHAGPFQFCGDLTMTDQLALFEPTGREVLALAKKHGADATHTRALAETMNVRGWTAIAEKLAHAAQKSERLSEEMLMLAEFEALGGAE